MIFGKWELHIDCHNKFIVYEYLDENLRGDQLHLSKNLKNIDQFLTKI